MKWRCVDCGHIHRGNPTNCSNCNGTVLQQHRSERESTVKTGAVGVGTLAWLAAVLVNSTGGLLNALTNPFMWWLSFKEALEFLIYLISGGSLGTFVALYGSPETVAVFAGWLGIIGWVSLGYAFYGRNSRSFALNFFFVPLLSLIAAGYAIREEG